MAKKRKKQRKSRHRCAFVEARTERRCKNQVKRAGNTYCSCACSTAARMQRAVPSSAKGQPGGRALYRLHRAKDVERLTTQLRQVADKHGLVSIMAAVPIAMAVGDVRYNRGYTAALARRKLAVRTLRLRESKAALDSFLGTRFGKEFVTGNLKPDDLAKFKFGFLDGESG